MLKELNSLASGLLGLHGFPVRPIRWSGHADARESDGAGARRAHEPARPRPRHAAQGAPASAPSANGHVHW